MSLIALGKWSQWSGRDKRTIIAVDKRMQDDHVEIATTSHTIKNLTKKENFKIGIGNRKSGRVHRMHFKRGNI